MYYIFLTLLLIIADQLTKLATINRIKPIGTKEIVSGILSLTYVENRGAAFGIMQNSRWFFIIFTAAVILAIVLYTIKTNTDEKLYLTSVSLICAGGIGNLIDRIFRGYVVDMIEITFIDYPVFNFADICVVTGVILLCVYVLFAKDVEK